MRSYQLDCDVARSLDWLGERWSLMILRDLCSGPWRFTDLLDSLPGIGPNLLSARLRTLVARGLVDHDHGDYRLSAAGQSVRPLLRELMALGRDLEPVAAPVRGRVSARVALGVMFDSRAARGESLAVAVQVGEEQFALLVANGFLSVVPGTCPVAADVSLQSSWSGFVAASRGKQVEGFRVRGHARALSMFRRLFSLPDTA